MRYRYPRQKARYLSAALRRLADEVPPTDDVSFRDWLTEFDGIGPKTASWVTRNYRHSDQVAILDVHIQRAGRLAGVFYACDRVDRHYRDMETRLVRFAVALGVRLSVLDSMIWGYMKRMSRDAMTPLAAA
jgi:thermostable 8-oxoguanine DNA glycosylase